MSHESLGKPAMNETEMIPRYVNEFILFDLDDTLIDTNAFGMIVADSLEKNGIETERVEAFRSSLLNSRGSGKSLYELLDDQGITDTVAVEREVLKSDKKVVNPNVVALIRKLLDLGIPCAIFTTGEDDPQSLKLAMFHLETGFSEEEVPSVITKVNSKSDEIKVKWKPDGPTDDLAVEAKFTVGKRIYTKKVVIVDDKTKNLPKKGDTGPVRGVFIDNSEESPEGSVNIQELTVERLLAA